MVGNARSVFGDTRDGGSNAPCMLQNARSVRRAIAGTLLPGPSFVWRYSMPWSPRHRMLPFRAPPVTIQRRGVHAIECCQVRRVCAAIRRRGVHTMEWCQVRRVCAAIRRRGVYAIECCQARRRTRCHSTPSKAAGCGREAAGRAEPPPRFRFHLANIPPSGHACANRRVYMKGSWKSQLPCTCGWRGKARICGFPRSYGLPVRFAGSGSSRFPCP